MKNKLPTKGLMCGLVFFVAALSAIGASSFDNHEIDSKDRYTKMQDRLNQCFETGDEKGLHLLTDQLETQLKLEDFLIKFREAEHAKITVWVPIFLSTIVSGVISVLTTVLTMRARER